MHSIAAAPVCDGHGLHCPPWWRCQRESSRLPSILRAFCSLFREHRLWSSTNTPANARRDCLAAVRVAPPMTASVESSLRFPTFRCGVWAQPQMTIPFFSKHFLILVTMSWHSVACW
eukprot:scaffold1141_cov333-Pavlova_lutheri.AAC.31